MMKGVISSERSISAVVSTTSVITFMPAEQPHLDDFMNAGRIEIGHQRRDKGVVRLMREGGRLCAVVVAGEAKHAAISRRARGVAVTEDVARTVDARTLAVPDADDAVIFRARREVKLLA